MYTATASVMAILTVNTSAVYVYGAKLKGAGYIIVSHCSKMNLVPIIQYKFYTFLTCAITAVFDQDSHCCVRTIATVMESATTVVNE